MLNKRVTAVSKARYDKLKRLDAEKLRELTVSHDGSTSLEGKWQLPYYNKVLLLPKSKHLLKP
jgi:hypothetical protein